MNFWYNLEAWDIMTRCAAWSGADRGSDGGGYVDLSGVIFIRSTSPPKGKPLDPEYDDLNLGWKMLDGCDMLWLPDCQYWVSDRLRMIKILYKDSQRYSQRRVTGSCPVVTTWPGQMSFRVISSVWVCMSLFLWRLWGPEAVAIQSHGGRCRALAVNCRIWLLQRLCWKMGEIREGLTLFSCIGHLPKHAV